MGRRTRECYLCGTSYKYCPTCSEDRAKPSWMAEFHSEDCVRIFDICTRFNMGVVSKIEAQEVLNTCDLSNKKNFKSCVQRDLAVIFEEESAVDVEVKTVENVQDESNVEVTPIVRNRAKKQSHEVVKQENE